jgi:uncharacterized membrane protein
MEAKHFLLISVLVIFLGFMTKTEPMTTILLATGGFIFGWNVTTIVLKLKNK